MKMTRNKLLLILVLFLALIVFFIFHVPDSVESRVNELSKIIELNESSEAKGKFEDFMSKYNDEDKLAIFENIPFALMKDNRTWMVESMNESLPSWEDSESFNAKYLLTELKLEERRNMRVIKNIDEIKIKKSFNSINSIVDTIYVLGEENWDVKKGGFYVVNEGINLKLFYEKNGLDVKSFDFKIFDIENSYIFDVKYENSLLTISPTLDQYEDDGAYELGEKIKFYEVERFKEYFSEKYSLAPTVLSIEFSDDIFKKPEDASDDKAEYMKILFNRSEIKELDSVRNLTYVGSMRIEFMKEVTSQKENDKEEKKEDAQQKRELVSEKSLYINLFKDM